MSRQVACNVLFWTASIAEVVVVLAWLQGWISTPVAIVLGVLAVLGDVAALVLMRREARRKFLEEAGVLSP